MTFATLETEIQLNTPSKIGLTGRLNNLISQEANTNIKAFWAGELNDQGRFSFITNDNDKVKEVLRGSEFSKFDENEVVVIRTLDQLGSVAEVASKIAEAGINIHYMFTTVFDGESAVIVYTEDNQKVLNLFG